jgi:hypothetical protein
MKENQKKAFDFASDTTKQLITISTAVIALSITFSKDIIGGAENSPKSLLIWTWAVFIFSIICGVATLMTLTGTLQPLSEWKKRKTQTSTTSTSSPPSSMTVNHSPDEFENLNINNGNIRLFSMLQAISFIVAIILTGVFGYKSLSNQTIKYKHKNEYQVIRHSTLNNDSTIYIDTLYLNKF